MREIHGKALLVKRLLHGASTSYRANGGSHVAPLRHGRLLARRPWLAGTRAPARRWAALVTRLLMVLHARILSCSWGAVLCMNLSVITLLLLPCRCHAWILTDDARIVSMPLCLHLLMHPRVMPAAWCGSPVRTHTRRHRCLRMHGQA